MFLRPATAIIALCSLCGCTTHLETAEVKSSATPQNGGVYHLPVLSYEIDVTRVLKSCPKDSNPEFDITVKVQPSVIAGEAIAVDYQKLTNWLKTSDFVLENYPSGILKSINVGVQDQSKPFVTEAAKAAASVAKMTVGVPPVTGSNLFASKRPSLSCKSDPYNPKVASNLSAIDLQIKSYEESVENKSNNLERFDATHSETQRSNHDNNQRSKLVEALLESKDLLVSAQQKKGKALDALTIRSHYKFVPSRGNYFLIDAVATLPEAEKNKVEKLFAVTAVANDLNLDLGFENNKRDAKEKLVTEENQKLFTLLSYADVVFAMESMRANPLETISLNKPDHCQIENKDYCGIVYRTRKSAKLQICSNISSVDKNDLGSICSKLAPTDTKVLYREDRLAPQFGDLMSLPLENGMFTDNRLTADFSEDGVLTKISYKKNSSEAVAAVSSLNEGLGAVKDAISYAGSAQFRHIQNEKALQDARAGINSPAEIAATTEASTLSAELAKTKAEIELLKAQRELDSLKK